MKRSKNPARALPRYNARDACICGVCAFADVVYTGCIVQYVGCTLVGIRIQSGVEFNEDSIECDLLSKAS